MGEFGEFEGLTAFDPLLSEHLRISQFTEDDITAEYIGWLNSPEVMRYSNQRFHKHDLKSCTRYFKSFDGTPNLFLSIRLRQDDVVIGTMTAYRNLHHATADVGIMIGSTIGTGRGFGVEAWKSLIGWLLVDGGARKVTAGTLACNHAMVRLAEKSGMTLEGTRLAQEIVDDQPQDMLLFGKFAK